MPRRELPQVLTHGASLIAATAAATATATATAALALHLLVWSSSFQSIQEASGRPGSGHGPHGRGHARGVAILLAFDGLFTLLLAVAGAAAWMMGYGRARRSSSKRAHASAGDAFATRTKTAAAAMRAALSTLSALWLVSAALAQRFLSADEGARSGAHARTGRVVKGLAWTTFALLAISMLGLILNASRQGSRGRVPELETGAGPDVEVKPHGDDVKAAPTGQKTDDGAARPGPATSGGLFSHLRNPWARRACRAQDQASVDANRAPSADSAEWEFVDAEDTIPTPGDALHASQAGQGEGRKRQGFWRDRRGGASSRVDHARDLAPSSSKREISPSSSASLSASASASVSATTSRPTQGDASTPSHPIPKQASASVRIPPTQTDEGPVTSDAGASRRMSILRLPQSIKTLATTSTAPTATNAPASTSNETGSGQAPGSGPGRVGLNPHIQLQRSGGSAPQSPEMVPY